jgi:hypothetical protein
MANDERVLRIGIIQGVRVLEERVVERRAAVTIGSSAGCTFHLPASELPKSVTLFDVKDGSYSLLVDDAMTGRIEQPTGKVELSSLRAGAPKQDGLHRIALTPDMKGRVKLSDDVTVLFHFVAPPVAVVAQKGVSKELGAGFVGTFRSVEPVYAAALAASFVVHLALGGYVKVTEPPAPTEEDLRALVERIQPPKVDLKPPPVAPTPTNTDDPNIGKGKDTDVAEAKPTGKGGGEKSGGGGGGAGSGKTKGGGGGGVGDRAAMRAEIAGKGILALIGGRGGGGDGGGAVGSVFGAGAGISDDVGAALSGTAGIGIAGGAGGGAGVTRRGAGGGDGSGGDGTGEGGAAAGIGELRAGGGNGGGSIDTGAKTAAVVKSRVTTDQLGEVDGSIDKKTVGATIRRRQDGFQACYDTALKQNSKLGGKLVVEFTIGEDGRVTEARAVKDGLNSAEVSSCVVSLLKRLKFPPAKDGEATVTNTFVFQSG